MIKYIDCDGVILDTETGLFDVYNELKLMNPELKKKQYLHDLDWDSWIEQASVLDNAVDLLKFYYCDVVKILTRVHSMNEAIAKINYFRDNGVKNDIIIVPPGMNKTNIVDAFGNILVEDSNSNLVDWNECHGISIYYGKGESNFTSIKSLEEVLDDTKCKKLIKEYKKGSFYG